MGSGGAQRILLNVLNELSRSDHEFELFLYNPSESYFLPEVKELGIPINSVERHSHGFSIKVLTQLIKTLSNQFDAIFSFQSTANIYCSIARLASPKTKLVCCEYTIVNEWSSHDSRLLANFFNLFSNAVICNSNTQASYISSFPGMKKKTFAIWNGYDLKKFKKRDYSEKSLKKITVIGRISFAKNGVNFVRGLELYIERNGRTPSINWVGRRDFDKPAQEMYEKMVELISANTLLEENWSWLGEVENIEGVYHSTDCIVLPSLYEGLPNVLCEAMLYGCPILASNVSDIPKLIGDDERGILFDPLSPEDICRAIESFENKNLHERLAMIENARIFAFREFDQKIMLKRYLDVLDRKSA